MGRQDVFARPVQLSASGWPCSGAARCSWQQREASCPPARGAAQAWDAGEGARGRLGPRCQLCPALSRLSVLPGAVSPPSGCPTPCRIALPSSPAVWRPPWHWLTVRLHVGSKPRQAGFLRLTPVLVPGAAPVSQQLPSKHGWATHFLASVSLSFGTYQRCLYSLCTGRWQSR